MLILSKSLNIEQTSVCKRITYKCTSRIKTLIFISIAHPYVTQQVVEDSSNNFKNLSLSHLRLYNDVGFFFRCSRRI